MDLAYFTTILSSRYIWQNYISLQSWPVIHCMYVHAYVYITLLTHLWMVTQACSKQILALENNATMTKCLFSIFCFHLYSVKQKNSQMVALFWRFVCILRNIYIISQSPYINLYFHWQCLFSTLLLAFVNVLYFKTYYSNWSCWEQIKGTCPKYCHFDLRLQFT